MNWMYPYFNRFDICGAYYIAATKYILGWQGEEILQRLSRMHYRPGLSERNGRLSKGGEFDNERAILARILWKYRRSIRR